MCAFSPPQHISLFCSHRVCRHGGSTVSQYLRQEFHGLFESVNKSQIPETFAWIKEIGGYFKRFQGGPLAPWVKDPDCPDEMDLNARATLAFFEVCTFNVCPTEHTEVTAPKGRPESLWRTDNENLWFYGFSRHSSFS